jgi:radical SAM superfamily enzyme YgiQ (UPF0313 family)
LVGSEQQENLGLEYLAAALERAGHEVEVLPLESRADVDSVCRTILARQPELVGLSIAFQHAVRDYLLLVRTLRERGFRGHLTCGGHVPTFCYAELLRDAPGLDSVVRFEGEAALGELLDNLDAPRRWTATPSVVSRDAQGQIVPGPSRALCTDLDGLASPRRRAAPFFVGGLPLAFVITARGCFGDCSYCCLSAFSEAAGGPRLRLRQPEAVAQEIASLRRSRGVRVVVVQDDLFILPSERQSIERMDRIGDCLAAHGIDDVVFWIKGRPETITPAVLAAARRMGAIHLFLGVESASAERLRYLGRAHDPADNERAIALCREHGLMPSFNLMLFDPDCTLDDVATTIEFAAANSDLPWNVCRTEIYSGTPLLDRLAAEGRLSGDYRGYGYRIADPRAEVLFRILRVCLHDRALACDSLINRLISLSFARQIHQRFFPGPAADRLAAEVAQLLRAIYRDTVERLQASLELARSVDPDDRVTVTDFAAEQGLAIHRWDAERSLLLTDLWRRLHARGATLGAREPTT